MCVFRTSHQMTIVDVLQVAHVKVDCQYLIVSGGAMASTDECLVSANCDGFADEDLFAVVAVMGAMDHVVFVVVLRGISMATSP